MGRRSLGNLLGAGLVPVSQMQVLLKVELHVLEHARGLQVGLSLWVLVAAAEAQRLIKMRKS